MIKGDVYLGLLEVRGLGLPASPYFDPKIEHVFELNLFLSFYYYVIHNSIVCETSIFLDYLLILRFYRIY